METGVPGSALIRKSSSSVGGATAFDSWLSLRSSFSLNEHLKMTQDLPCVGVWSPSREGPPAPQEAHLDMRTSLAIKKNKTKQKSPGVCGHSRPQERAAEMMVGETPKGLIPASKASQTSILLWSRGRQRVLHPQPARPLDFLSPAPLSSSLLCVFSPPLSPRFTACLFVYLPAFRFRFSTKSWTSATSRLAVAPRTISNMSLEVAT